jgi:hypothetical protein
MNILRTSICIILLLATFCSCEKAVKIKLRSATDQNFVEGTVTDLPVPYTVVIVQMDTIKLLKIQIQNF